MVSVSRQVGVLTGNGDHCDFVVRAAYSSTQSLEAVRAHYRAQPLSPAILVFMRDGLRLAIYLGRTIRVPCFFKVGRMSTNRIIHVAMLRTLADWRSVRPYLKEAFRFAQEEDAARQKSAGKSTTSRPKTRLGA